VLVRDAGAVEDEVTGEAVTVARRFEQAAGPDQILIGAATYRLVADAVRAEKADPSSSTASASRRTSGACSSSSRTVPPGCAASMLP
jgi:class 3 adenylate cyclase